MSGEIISNNPNAVPINDPSSPDYAVGTQGSHHHVATGEATPTTPSGSTDTVAKHHEDQTQNLNISGGANINSPSQPAILPPQDTNSEVVTAQSQDNAATPAPTSTQTALDNIATLLTEIGTEVDALTAPPPPAGAPAGNPMFTPSYAAIVSEIENQITQLNTNISYLSSQFEITVRNAQASMAQQTAQLDIEDFNAQAQVYSNNASMDMMNGIMGILKGGMQVLNAGLANAKYNNALSQAKTEQESAQQEVDNLQAPAAGSNANGLPAANAGVVDPKTLATAQARLTAATNGYAALASPGGTGGKNAFIQHSMQEYNTNSSIVFDTATSFIKSNTESENASATALQGTIKAMLDIVRQYQTAEQQNYDLAKGAVDQAQQAINSSQQTRGTITDSAMRWHSLA